MTTETQPAQPAQTYEDIEAALLDPKAFAREERFTLNQIADVRVEPMPDDVMERRQIDFRSPAFQSLFPRGFLSLHLQLRGIDVEYAYDPEGIRHIWIPLYNDSGPRAGSMKGRGSQNHVVTEAFEQVFGVRPFGQTNQEKLKGRKARWGQHLGSATLDGEKREWAWDVPREVLPDDFQYQGEVRRIEGQTGGAPAVGQGLGGQSIGAVDVQTAVLEAIVGLDGGESAVASQKVMDIAGLPNEWYDAAAESSVFNLAYEKGWITLDEDNKVQSAVVPAEAIRSGPEAAGEGEAPAEQRPSMPVPAEER